MRHDRLAADSDLSNPICVRIQDLHFDSRQWLSHSVSAEGIQIIYSNHGASLCAAIPVPDRNPEIVEKLESGRLCECAANEKGAKFAPESGVYLRQKSATERQPRATASERAVRSNQYIQNLAAPLRQFVKFLAQAALKIFQHQRNHAHVGDVVTREGIAN